ncbi:MAG: hypothetical protein JW997_03460 [Actinobacteria bacterium]|nr:hypothetical protein [Actinomycetota bacterium]
MKEKEIKNINYKNPVKTIIISAKSFEITVQLNETETAKKLIEVLPLSSSASRWGDEIYFSIPLHAEIENGIEEVEIGTVAFWPPGSALCIFFGPTPASQGKKPKAASPVTVVGSFAAEGVIEKLRSAKSGEKIIAQPGSESSP